MRPAPLKNQGFCYAAVIPGLIPGEITVDLPAEWRTAGAESSARTWRRLGVSGAEEQGPLES